MLKRLLPAYSVGLLYLQAATYEVPCVVGETLTDFELLGVDGVD